MNFETKLFGYLLFALPLTFLVQLVINIGEAIEFKRTKKILSNGQFNELLSFGFHKTFTDKKSKWLSSQPMFVGQVDKYPVKLKVEKRVVRVIAGADLDLIEKSHMKELKNIFGKDNVEYDIGIALLFRPSRYKNLIFQDFYFELKQFISFLKINKINPWDENGNA